MGRARLANGETEQQRIAREKREFLAYYRLIGVKTAAAKSLGRLLDTINDWKKADPEFSAEVRRAEAEFLKSSKRHVRWDYLFANLFPELKPPKTEVDASGTITNNHALADASALVGLLAAAGFAPVAGAGDREAGPDPARPVD
jgi:hypothetical protein